MKPRRPWLGDKRDDSIDSRMFGFLPTGGVRARPWTIYLSRDPDRGRVRWERIGRPLH